MVSQVKLVLVCAFKFYNVVWSTILKPKKGSQEMHRNQSREFVHETKILRVLSKCVGGIIVYFAITEQWLKRRTCDLF